MLMMDHCTFQKLLARVLLEERVVLHWAVQVIDHEKEDRFNLLFCVAGVVSESGVLLILVIEEVKKKMIDVPIHRGQEQGAQGTLSKQQHGWVGIPRSDGLGS
jgi:hypothetical protein